MRFALNKIYYKYWSFSFGSDVIKCRNKEKLSFMEYDMREFFCLAVENSYE